MIDKITQDKITIQKDFLTFCCNLIKQNKNVGTIQISNDYCVIQVESDNYKEKKMQKIGFACSSLSTENNLEQGGDEEEWE